MSITEQTSGKGPGGLPPADPETDSARRRGRFRWWWLLPPVALLVAAAATVLTMLAATYQPLVPGPVSGPNLIPGMPKAQGVRWVNTFGASPGDLYVPPQLGTFTLGTSITNTGTHAVTIEGVSLLGTDGHWPVIPIGPARYYLVKGGPGQPALHLLRNVTLRPGDMMVIGIPVRAAAPCARKNDWTSIDSFLVRERFLAFTHTLPVPFSPTGARVILRAPGGHPGDPNVVCAST